MIVTLTKLTYPDPNVTFPMGKEHNVVFIKNVIKNPNIIIGDYTYYHGFKDAENFEDRILYHFDFIGDKLIIGKFCAIASGITFIMNGANHKLDSFTTYPFWIMGGGWEQNAPQLGELPYKGDTTIGDDVWIGYDVTIMPGINIGSGSVIASKSVVVSDIPAYSIAGGNPCKVLKQRFDDEAINFLLELKWWDMDYDKVSEIIPYLMNPDLDELKKYLDK